MTIEQAIKHAKEVAASKCDECGKEHQQLAEWLQELQGYKDETQITEKWLNANFQFGVVLDNAIKMQFTTTLQHQQQVG